MKKQRGYGRKHTYGVTVGNIGNPLETTNFCEAQKTFTEYVKQSKIGYGRAAGEEVILWKDGEPFKEYGGKLNN